jgi:hypothetical protein
MDRGDYIVYCLKSRNVSGACGKMLFQRSTIAAADRLLHKSLSLPILFPSVLAAFKRVPFATWSFRPVSPFSRVA